MTSVPLFACAICSHEDGAVYHASEKMFGMGGSFNYFQCSACHCLQIMNPPPNLAAYYPAEYYTNSAPPERSGLRRRLRELRNQGTFLSASPLSRLLATRMEYPLRGARHWFEGLGVTRSTRVLDVGCGDGMVVRDLAALGFTSVLGIDPFASTSVALASGARIERAYVREITGEFDVVMMNHSFEHVPNPLETLRAIAARMHPQAWCIIRIPTVSSWAWEHYRENWVQLDAPRHFFLHSLESIALVAASAGLKVVRTDFDATEFQFMGSEQYVRGRTLQNLDAAFSSAEVRAYRAKANELNAERRGDQIVCYMQLAG
jgi:SAM-dependent methyltransferase